MYSGFTRLSRSVVLGCGVLLVSLAAGGCAAPGRRVDLALLHGTYPEVTKACGLDRFESWPVMNLPSGEDQGTTYFLDEGNLVIWWTGRDPQVLRNAEFWPSDKPAKERKREADEGWAEWVKAHSGK
jgi:hypothetical protein